MDRKPTKKLVLPVLDTHKIVLTLRICSMSFKFEYLSKIDFDLEANREYKGTKGDLFMKKNRVKKSQSVPFALFEKAQSRIWA